MVKTNTIWRIIIICICTIFVLSFVVILIKVNKDDCGNKEKGYDLNYSCGTIKEMIELGIYPYREIERVIFYCSKTRRYYNNKTYYYDDYDIKRYYLNKCIKDGN